MGLLDEMLAQGGVQPPGLMNQPPQAPPMGGSNDAGLDAEIGMGQPGPMVRPPMGPPQAPQAGKKPMKEVISDFAGNFLYALSRAMAASAQAPGQRGSMMGTAAALETPMLMQQAMAQQQAENRKLQMELERLNIDKKKADNDATRLDAQEQLAKLNAEIARAKEAREKAAAEREAQKPIEVSPNATLVYPDNRPPYTAPGPTPTVNLQHVEIEDPANRKLPLVANYNPSTGKTTHPKTGEVIEDPRPFKEAPGEPGQYLPMTDSRGVVTGWVNPKTRQVVTAESLGVGGQFRGAMSPDRQKMEANAQSGLRAIATLRAELKNPAVLKALSIPGSPTARKARAARGEMIDVMTRLRTGAALNADEQRFYRDQAPNLIDALFADPDTIEYKLSIFENEFNALAGKEGGLDTAKPKSAQDEADAYLKSKGLK